MDIYLSMFAGTATMVVLALLITPELPERGFLPFAFAILTIAAGIFVGFRVYFFIQDKRRDRKNEEYRRQEEIREHEEEQKRQVLTRYLAACNQTVAGLPSAAKERFQMKLSSTLRTAGVEKEDSEKCEISMLFTFDGLGLSGIIRGKYFVYDIQCSGGSYIGKKYDFLQLYEGWSKGGDPELYTAMLNMGITLSVVPLEKIAYFRLEGNVQYTNQLDATGGGANIGNAVIGAAIAGGTGAIIGSRVGTEIQTKNKTVTHDNRRIQFLYTDSAGQMYSKNICTNIDASMDALRRMLPQKDYAYLSVQGH